MLRPSLAISRMWKCMYMFIINATKNMYKSDALLTNRRDIGLRTTMTQHAAAHLCPRMLHIL